MQETIRLTKQVKEILSPYSEDATKAIKEMKVRIDYLEGENSKLKAISDALQSKTSQPVHWTSNGSLNEHNQKYWVTLKAAVTESLQEYSMRH